jgi:threonyl-tRNA synthetase
MYDTDITASETKIASSLSISRHPGISLPPSPPPPLSHIHSALSSAPLVLPRALHALRGPVLAQAGKTAEAPAPTPQQQQQKEDDAWRSVPLPTSDESEQMLRLRHSSAHVMAMAVQRIFPKAQVREGARAELTYLNCMFLTLCHSA